MYILWRFMVLTCSLRGVNRGPNIAALSNSAQYQ